ncbi:hypothetical protein FGO68_gene11477 [Halteria grandinella]|uniref:Uncharacterized protein n=1 Tax=Halteria grandinella TaxID=5974 RepID=A0A8J8T834_HALGN|nr:hypothetical protein FGO68_gene11477 [Halteria grandinella]
MFIFGVLFASTNLDFQLGSSCLSLSQKHIALCGNWFYRIQVCSLVIKPFNRLKRQVEKSFEALWLPLNSDILAFI